jgi:uncharacterized iron-regulated membrane protein
MYHKIRSWHRTAGVIACLFLIVISATGFLLANKSRFAWMRPPARQGGVVMTMAEVISIERAIEAAIGLNRQQIRHHQDIERVDYRPDKNIFKVISNDGYLEVQVDGKTGEVLSASFRTDQLTEDIHDLSFFTDWLHDYGLSVVAILLFTLASSGIVIYSVPFIRRGRYKRNLRKQGTE